jgi:hypothetical protein
MAKPKAPLTNSELEQLGLRDGDRVRFAPKAEARPQEGTVRGSNKDGSLTITDGKGASRAIPPERVWRSARTARGKATWLPLMGEEQQLELFRPSDL